MSGILNKLRDAAPVSKGEGMSGLGADQSALFTDESTNKAGLRDDINADEMEAKRGPAQINSFGGPGYGATSTIQPHSSNLLNKLDPRVGMTEEERAANVTKYEAKYGTVGSTHPDGKKQDAVWDGTKGREMSGMGADQEALTREFRET